jgi:hypothetical protein
MTDKKTLLIKRTNVPKYLKESYGIDISNACVERWIRKGVRGCILRCQYVGGCRYIQESDIIEFVENRNHPSYQRPMGEKIEEIRERKRRENQEKRQRIERYDISAENLKKRGITVMPQDDKKESNDSDCITT